MLALWWAGAPLMGHQASACSGRRVLEKSGLRRCQQSNWETREQVCCKRGKNGILLGSQKWQVWVISCEQRICMSSFPGLVNDASLFFSHIIWLQNFKDFLWKSNEYLTSQRGPGIFNIPLISFLLHYGLCHYSINFLFSWQRRL